MTKPLPYAELTSRTRRINHALGYVVGCPMCRDAPEPGYSGAKAIRHTSTSIRFECVECAMRFTILRADLAKRMERPTEGTYAGLPPFELVMFQSVLEHG